jgi:hypothetical protein
MNFRNYFWGQGKCGRYKREEAWQVEEGGSVVGRGGRRCSRGRRHGR